jgi:hypothetical protein
VARKNWSPHPTHVSTRASAATPICTARILGLKEKGLGSQGWYRALTTPVSQCIVFIVLIVERWIEEVV